MAVLEWDQVGERFYQTGIDKGVLYLKDGRVVPWNGLTSIDDNTSSELKSYYLDGIKILDHIVPGEFSGKLSAFTYPDEFDEVLGVVPIGPGLVFYEQPSKSFNLSYRTKIGNDLDSNYGYKIHLLYNLRANSDSHKFETLKADAEPGEFSWSLSGIPDIISGHRPTIHISIDSTNTDPEILQQIEEILYGTDLEAPRFPEINEIKFIFGVVDSVVDHLAMQSPDDSIWDITVTDDGTISVSPSLDSIYLDHVMIQSPDSDVWNITVTNDGTLNIAVGVTSDPLEDIHIKSPDNTIWIIDITNDGTIDVTAV